MAHRFYKDITGERFGRLIVIAPSGTDKHNKKLWLCKCDCGKEITTRGSRLRAGRVRSCGCLALEKQSQPKGKRGLREKTKNKYIGRKYGNLTVIDVLKDDDVIYFGFKCHCGGTGISSKRNFDKGCVKSCGCIKERISKRAAIKTLITTLIKIKIKQNPPPHPLKGTHQYCKIKHNYDGVKIKGATIISHAGVRLNSNGRIVNHLFYAKCNCGRDTVVTLTQIKNEIIRCSICSYRHKIINVINTAKKRNLKNVNKQKNNRRKYEKDRRHKPFQRDVIAKYHNSCCICGRSDKRRYMNIHHLKPFSKYPEYRFMPCNAVLMCKKCHEKFHKTYGWEGFSVADFVEYKKSVT